MADEREAGGQRVADLNVGERLRARVAGHDRVRRLAAGEDVRRAGVFVDLEHPRGLIVFDLAIERGAE